MEEANHSALLNNVSVYGILEYMENKIIITMYPTGILILEEWLTTSKIEDASNNNI